MNIGTRVIAAMGHTGVIVGFPCRLSALVRFESGNVIRCWLSDLELVDNTRVPAVKK